MRSMLTLLSLFLLACQPEPVGDPAVEGEGPPAGPPPEAGDPGPGGGGPDRDAPVTARLEGTLVLEGFTGGMLQVDVVGERDGSPQVVGMERYEQPGPFRIAVRGDFDAVNLVVYVDADGDGPSAGDLRVEYEGNPISIVDLEVVEGLEVDLSKAEAQDGTPKDAEEEQAERGEGAPAEGDPAAGSGDAEAPPPEGEQPPEGGLQPEAEPPPTAPAAPSETEPAPPAEDAAPE